MRRLIRPPLSSFFHISAILALYQLTSCTRPPASERDGLIQLTLTAQREDFGTYGFLSGSQGMVWSKPNLWVADSENSRLLSLNAALQVQKQVGKAGPGPGELMAVGPFALFRDRLFANNMEAAGLSVFDTEGTFLEAIPLPFCSFATQFAIYDEILFLSTPAKDRAITAAGLDGEVLYQFCAPVPFPEERVQIVRNHKHLAIVETSEMPVLVAVAGSEPLIESFSLDGVPLASLKLERHPLLQARLALAREFHEQHPEKRFNSTFVLTSHISVSGDGLYVLVADQTPPFRILKFTVTKDQLKYDHALEIQEPISIHAFTVTEDQDVYLFDGRTSQLRHYSGRPTAKVNLQKTEL